MTDLLWATALVGLYSVVIVGSMGYALYRVYENAVAAWDLLCRASS